MITKKVKLSSMPYAQAEVHFNDKGYIALRSYNTYVAVIDDVGLLEVRGLYSATTRRHLSAFAREYCNADYSIIKRCYEEHLLFDIKDRWFSSMITGEAFPA